MIKRLYFKRRYGNEPGSSGNDGGSGTGGGTGGSGGGEGSGNPAAFPDGITPEAQRWLTAESQRLTDLAAGNIRKQVKEQFDRERQEQQTAAETEAATKRGEFERLYNAEVTAHNTTKATAARVETLSTAIHTSIDNETANWSPDLKALDPGKDAPAETRLNWLTSARALAAKLSGTGNGRPAPPQGEHGSGNGGNRPQNGNNNQQQGPGNTKEAVAGYIGNTYKRPDGK